MNHSTELYYWRKQRPALKANHRIYFQNIIEELLEPLYTKETVKNYTRDICSRYYPAHMEPIDDEAVLDSICDVQVFSINEVELMGYDNDKCMDETVKEISSRKQDPIQQELWFKSGYDGTKWMKDINQDPSTLYKADYNRGKK